MNKIVSTILLTESNKYVSKDGKIPGRANFDKEFLSAMIKGELLSKKGYDMLPPSMQKDCFTSDVVEPYPITIPEIDALTDLLIVVRSSDVIPDGKEFKFTNFTKITRQGALELWKRK